MGKCSLFAPSAYLTREKFRRHPQVVTLGKPSSSEVVRDQRDILGQLLYLVK
jgi:hypothetical protein